jgi:hypothetical protein
MSHYAAAAAMDGHGSSLYDPHGRHSMPGATTALSHSHSPNFSHAGTGLQNPYPNYSTPSSGMQGVMNSAPADSQVKRDKDSIYG